MSQRRRDLLVFDLAGASTFVRGLHDASPKVEGIGRIGAGVFPCDAGRVQATAGQELCKSMRPVGGSAIGCTAWHAATQFQNECLGELVLADVRAVVFDLDGTLLDRRRSFERFAHDQWERFADVLQVADREQYVRTLIELDGDGYGPRRALFTGMIARFELPATLAETLLNDYRAGFPGACVLFPDASRTLSSLRGCGMKLGLITNGSVRMQSQKLQCLALSPMLDTILISDAEGISKPDRRIFHRALERLNVSPSSAVYVGDHPEVDVAGARGAGMRAVWRRDPIGSEVVEADAIVDEVGDLLPLLGLERDQRNPFEKGRA